MLATRGAGYQLELEPAQVDAGRFEALLRRGRDALAGGDPRAAAAALAEALGLWRGPALAEFSEPFAAAEAPRLEELRLAAWEERIDADLALGRHAEVVGEIEALIARHPLRERLRGQRMLALYRSGRQAEALAAYQEARRVLSEELGLEPSGALRELERRILRQDAALEPPAPPPSPAPAPPGVPMAGRRDELGRLRAHLERARAGEAGVVLVTGDAGIGKTTLVEAFLAGAASGPGIVVGRGQCVEPHGAGEAYLPVLDALGGLCRGPEGGRLVALLVPAGADLAGRAPGPGRRRRARATARPDRRRHPGAHAEGDRRHPGRGGRRSAGRPGPRGPALERPVERGAAGRAGATPPARPPPGHRHLPPGRRGRSPGGRAGP